MPVLRRPGGGGGARPDPRPDPCRCRRRNAAPPAGQGAGGRGPEPGDLHLTIRVRPHPYFHRSGLDIHAEVPITFAEAALGTEIEVPTLDGPVKVRLPGGTQGGQRFRLRDKGVRRGAERVGDHYYTVRIVVPEVLDAELEGVLRAVLRVHGDASLRRGLPSEPI